MFDKTSGKRPKTGCFERGPKRGGSKEKGKRVEKRNFIVHIINKSKHYEYGKESKETVCDSCSRGHLQGRGGAWQVTVTLVSGRTAQWDGGWTDKF